MRFYLVTLHFFVSYVSHLGVLAPEAQIFAIITSFESLLLIFLTIIRYEAIKTYIENNNKSKVFKQDLSRLNSISLKTGLSTATGFFMVSHFSLGGSLLEMAIHYIMASLLFISTVVEIYFQSQIDYLLSEKRTDGFRKYLFVSSSLLLIPFYLLSIDSYVRNIELAMDIKKAMMWHSGEPGYYTHVISAISEWLLVLNMTLYYLTFKPLFKNISLSNNLVVYKVHDN